VSCRSSVSSRRYNACENFFVRIQLETRAGSTIDVYADVIYFLQHPDPYAISNSSSPESVMLAYVQLYDIREHGAGLIEQVRERPNGNCFVEVKSIKTLLARLRTTGTISSQVERMWVIDRQRMYQILARANGYHWTAESSVEPEDEENDANLAENEDDDETLVDYIPDR